jgi:hypothetical protein
MNNLDIVGITHSISEYGFMAVRYAFFGVCIGTTTFFLARWFVKLTNQNTSRQQEKMEKKSNGKKGHVKLFSGYAFDVNNNDLISLNYDEKE